jgi:AAA+ ATPase superfamily predicted ATPase
MNDQGNPFLYGRPVERADELIDREGERAELLDAVRSGQPVMVYGPRRYGKTSLARVVEREAADEWGILAVHVDLWGVSSIADIVGVLGRAYARVSGVFRVRRFLADLLGSVGFSVNLGRTLSVSYQGSATAEEERAALRALLEVPRRLAPRAAGGRVLVVLDEFGEVLNVPSEPDALMRSAFQASPDVSFLFMGSKRSLMDGLFSDRRRPFYNFGRRMELGRLPYEPLGAFVEGRFEAAGGRITPEGVDVLLDLSQGHPHRAQQLAFHTFRLARASCEAADEETALAAKDEALDEAEPEFRAILDEMSPPRRAAFVALCKEPTDEPYSRPYMRRHGIKGSGALKSALDGLAASGYLEKKRPDARPEPTDPLLALWIRERMNGV